MFDVEYQKFPTYARPLMVSACGYARATDEKLVGHVSTLIKNIRPNSLEEWIEKHTELYPNALENASKRLYDKLQDFRSVIESLSMDDVRKWMEEFLYEKTFTGLSIQKAVLEFLSDKYQIEYRESNRIEEGRDIDGWLGTIALSVKPKSHTAIKNLPYRISDDIYVVYYQKKVNDVVIAYSIELERACRSLVEN